MKMLNLVLFGPPGAGKGTQSQKLIDKYGLVHLSTGDLLRSEIARGTELGVKAKSIMDRGELVSDDIVIGMIESKLDANPHAAGFIFDGFPRTKAQAEVLDDLLQKKGTAISGMLALEVNDDELLKRLLLRGAESGRADDQDEHIIRNRINEYNNKTLPLKEYYSAQGKYHSVYGIGSIEDIFHSLTERIKFIEAEIELTQLENDLEHLDMTVNDFEEATELVPELEKEIEQLVDEEARYEGKVNGSELENPELKMTIVTETIISEPDEDEDDEEDYDEEEEEEKVAPAPKKTSAPKKPAPKAKGAQPAKAAKKKTAAAPAKKAAKKAKPAAKKTAKQTPAKAAKKAAKPAAKKTAAKKAVAKKVVKKAAKKVAKKALKKAAPKKNTFKAAPKKALKKVSTKKAAKKVVKKAVAKNVVKKAAKKVLAKKVVKAAKKVVKKAIKKIAPAKKAKAMKPVAKKAAGKKLKAKKRK